MMLKNSDAEFITAGNVRDLDISPLETQIEHPIDPGVKRGVAAYISKAVGGQPGNIAIPTAEDFVMEVFSAEDQSPLFGSRAFSYPPVSGIKDNTGEPSAENTVRSATTNIQQLTYEYGIDTFAASDYHSRTRRSSEWTAALDEEFEIRIRGSSGASTVSLDFGIGTTRSEDGKYRYNELWRSGIDTEFSDEDMMGARIIRTGSGVKPGDTRKIEAFDRFRKQYGILPQRLLGLVGLYALREMKPEYALALTTEGAATLSTLNKSRGGCDYTGIFSNVGFEASSNPHWLIIDEYEDGFYEALDRADMNPKEVIALDLAVTALNAAEHISNDHDMPHQAPLKFCSDADKKTIQRELEIYLPPNL